jgi:hypothetical protein
MLNSLEPEFINPREPILDSGVGAGIPSLAWFPIGRCDDLMRRCQLERVGHTQDFVEVPAYRHRVNQEELDRLIRPDHVNVAPTADDLRLNPAITR